MLGRKRETKKSARCRCVCWGERELTEDIHQLCVGLWNFFTFLSLRGLSLRQGRPKGDISRRGYILSLIIFQYYEKPVLPLLLVLPLISCFSKERDHDQAYNLRILCLVISSFYFFNYTAVLCGLIRIASSEITSFFQLRHLPKQKAAKRCSI